MLRGKFGSPYLDMQRQQRQEQRYSYLPAYAAFSCVQTMTAWLPVFGIFNVRTDVDAYEGCANAVTDGVCTES